VSLESEKTLLEFDQKGVGPFGAGNGRRPSARDERNRERKWPFRIRYCI
jgi:hypothetical protein